MPPLRYKDRQYPRRPNCVMTIGLGHYSATPARHLGIKPLRCNSRICTDCKFLDILVHSRAHSSLQLQHVSISMSLRTARAKLLNFGFRRSPLNDEVCVAQVARPFAQPTKHLDRHDVGSEHGDT